MRRGSSRLALGSAMAAGVAIWWGADRGATPQPPSPAVTAKTSPTTAAVVSPRRSTGAPMRTKPMDEPLDHDPLKALEPGQAGWDVVDLEAVRA